MSTVYVASSWRNDVQPQVVKELEAQGALVYDFKNPPNGSGFHWSEVGLQRGNDLANEGDYLAALQHERSQEGFASDFDAMLAADVFVLVLPSGRSAHLEAGWAIGRGKPTAILLDGPDVTPELMYLMADAILTNVDQVIGWYKGVSRG